jgi:hypothetical protein
MNTLMIQINQVTPVSDHLFLYIEFIDKDITFPYQICSALLTTLIHICRALFLQIVCSDISPDSINQAWEVYPVLVEG